MDPASGIGIPVAFGAGLVSFLSPCVLPLVPGYISAVAGVAPSDIRARRVIGPSLLFVATFSTIFIAAGASNSAAHGAFLLAVYCAGLAVPFLLTSLAFGSMTSALAVVRRHYLVVIGAGGAVLIGMGVLMWTGEFTQLNVTVSHWLQSLHLPNLNPDT